MVVAHAATELVGELLGIFYHICVLLILLNLMVSMLVNSANEIIVRLFCYCCAQFTPHWSHTRTQSNELVEWKYVRARVWLEFEDDAHAVPPPLNLVWYLVRGIASLVQLLRGRRFYTILHSHVSKRFEARTLTVIDLSTEPVDGRRR